MTQLCLPRYLIQSGSLCFVLKLFESYLYPYPTKNDGDRYNKDFRVKVLRKSIRGHLKGVRELGDVCIVLSSCDFLTMFVDIKFFDTTSFLRIRIEYIFLLTF